MDRQILSSDMDSVCEQLSGQDGGKWTWDVKYPPYRHFLLKDGIVVMAATYMRELYERASAFMKRRNAA